MGPPGAPQQLGPPLPPPPIPSMGAPGMDPAQNNAPLQFNTNKGKPPMPISGTETMSPPVNPAIVNRRNEAPGNVTHHFKCCLVFTLLFQEAIL